MFRITWACRRLPDAIHKTSPQTAAVNHNPAMQLQLMETEGTRRGGGINHVRAFSSEVDTGSHQENASKQNARAWFRSAGIKALTLYGCRISTG
jgi:hypothetical protein